MLQFFALEIFKEFQLHSSSKKRYAISNYGRLISFTDKMENGRLLKGATVDNYRIFQYSTFLNGKKKSNFLFLGRTVATAFLEKTSDDQIFVLHLDYNRSNDSVTNLKWATREEMLAHQRKSPKVIAAKKRNGERQKTCDGKKLTITQVIRLKKQIFDPNRKTRLRLIAKQYGISEMQLYRIKRGENWSAIKV